MDEGGDVFQKVREDDGNLKDQVHRWRRRLRATFIFSRRRYGLGCMPSPPMPDEPRMKVAKIELPPTVDLRGQMLPVRDQGNEGTCVGFAVAALREASDEHDIELSPRYLYHHCKQKDGIPEIEGTYLRTAMQMLKAPGICNESYWPYAPRQVDKPKGSADTDAKGRIITDYIRLDDEDGEAMLMNLKYHLYNYGPFVAGVLAHEGWCKVKACKTGVIPDPTELERRLGGHAVCIVGYDDEHKRFIFKNSWGAEWGDEGYGYLSYDYMKCYCFEAWGIKAM